MSFFVTLSDNFAISVQPKMPFRNSIPISEIFPDMANVPSPNPDALPLTNATSSSASDVTTAALSLEMVDSELISQKMKDLNESISTGDAGMRTLSTHAH